tara:strand:+ start:528 stop:1229 length:702 start_codon:yes stop_codon:yes gene_type:complete
MKIMFIDYRERSGLEKLVMKYLDKNELKYQMKENMITDYAFANVGIEAKTIQDYMGSLYSGHLEKQLQNLDDNYTQMYLVVHGSLDSYIAGARRGGKKIPYAKAFNVFLGSLARFSTDYDINICHFQTPSEAARFICKRFEKDGTLGKSSAYRLMRKTASEDKRIDVLRTAGCTEAVAKILLKEYGSISEIVSVSPSELQTLPGIGKITATKILNCFISENPIVDEKIKMKRA